MMTPGTGPQRVAPDRTSRSAPVARKPWNLPNLHAPSNDKPCFRRPGRRITNACGPTDPLPRSTEAHEHSHASPGQPSPAAPTQGADVSRAVQALARRYDGLFPNGNGGGIPFAVRAPGGPAHRVGAGEPAFTLVAANSRGADALASLDQLAVGTGYLNGDIDLEGDFLARHRHARPVPATGTRSSTPGASCSPCCCGQVKSDEAWIAEHYDYDQDFYLLFLDTPAPLLLAGRVRARRRAAGRRQ